MKCNYCKKEISFWKKETYLILPIQFFTIKRLCRECYLKKDNEYHQLQIDLNNIELQYGE